MPDIQLKTHIIPYEIQISPRRKTLGIVVDYESGLRIRVPPQTADHEIERLLLKKADWILKKLQYVNEILPASRPKEFVSGERFPYIGRSYRLQVRKNSSTQAAVRFFKGQFLATIPNDSQNSYEQEIKQRFITWYRQRAIVKLQERVAYYAPKVGLVPTAVHIRELQARWGTCQEDDSIDFNWKIIMAPMSIIDYVVVHELCHLVTRDHSKIFWSKFSTILVDYQQRKEWLRIHGPTLTL